MKNNYPIGQPLAEFIGSMFLITAAISPMILLTSVLEADKSIAVFLSAITVVFVLSALIEMFAPISGAHFNPVVTMAMLLDKKISPSKAALFVVCQVAGGMAGTALSHLMFFDEVGGIFFVSSNVRGGYMYIGEIAGTFILILAILVLVKIKSGRISIIVALLVGGQVMATSSTMFANPQVTIARMFTNTAAGIRPINGLVFIVMQIIGALLAYGAYRLIFIHRPDNTLT